MGREENKIAAPSFSAGLIKKPCKGASAEKLASCKEAKKKHNLSVAAVEQFARMREDFDARGMGHEANHSPAHHRRPAPEPDDAPTTCRCPAGE